MHAKTLALISLAAISLLLLSGCIEDQIPVCGDGVCERPAESMPSLPTYCPQDCGGSVYHSECRQKKCELVAGEGDDECNIDEDCWTEQYHSECQSGQCVQVEGEGESECEKDADCGNGEIELEIKSSPEDPLPNEEAKLTIQVIHGADSPFQTIKIEFGDSGSETIDCNGECYGTSFDFNHVYLHAGNYLLYAFIVDEAGNSGKATKQLTVGPTNCEVKEGDIPEERVIKMSVPGTNGNVTEVTKILPGTGPYFAKAFDGKAYAVDLKTAKEAKGRFSIEDLDRLSSGEAKIIIEFKAKPVLERAKDERISTISSAGISQLKAIAASIAGEQSTLVSGISGKFEAFRKTRTFSKTFNGIAAEVKSGQLAEKINEVLENPLVRQVYIDKEVEATLDESIPQINADDVWLLKDSLDRNITGQGITIAIIDTGVDYTHEDLGGCLGSDCKVVGGHDLINNDSDPMDDQGHGTHVAATAAGNGVLKGVAPDAKIMAYKVLDSSGRGAFSTVIAGIEKAVDPNNDGDFSDRADVISLSLGGPGGADDPASQAIDNAVDNGTIATVSAGNSGGYNSIGSPGTARNAITVGAVDGTDTLASFSSGGPTMYSGGLLVKPDIVAPGVEICAAEYDSAWASRKCLDDKHVSISGTSMAAPHVAGTVALLLQAHPEWDYNMVKGALVGTAEDIGLNVFKQGSGRIDALAAVNALEATTPSSIGFSSVGGAAVTRGIKVQNLSDSQIGIRLVAPENFTLLGRTIGELPKEVKLPLSFADEEFCLQAGENNSTSALMGATVGQELGYYSGKAIVEVYSDCQFSSKTSENQLPIGFVKLKKVNATINPKPLEANEEIAFKEIGFISDLYYTKNSFYMGENQLSGTYYLDEEDYDLFYTNFVIVPDEAIEGAAKEFNPIWVVKRANLSGDDEINVQINENDALKVSTNAQEVFGRKGLSLFDTESELQTTNEKGNHIFSFSLGMPDFKPCPTGKSKEAILMEDNSRNEWNYSRVEWGKDYGLSFRAAENLAVVQDFTENLEKQVNFSYPEDDFSPLGTETNYFAVKEPIEWKRFMFGAYNTLHEELHGGLKSAWGVPVSTQVQKKIEYYNKDTGLWLGADFEKRNVRKYQEDFMVSVKQLPGKVSFFKGPFKPILQPYYGPTLIATFDDESLFKSKRQSRMLYDSENGTLTVMRPDSQGNRPIQFTGFGGGTISCGSNSATVNIGECVDGEYAFTWKQTGFASGDMQISKTFTLEAGNWRQ